MEIQDDRTPEEMESHKHLVIATDSFLSGWGKAQGGKSYCVWACETEYQFQAVKRWVEKRGDMKRVREGYGTYRPSGIGHCHIYAVKEGHPSLCSCNGYWGKRDEEKARLASLMAANKGK